MVVSEVVGTGRLGLGGGEGESIGGVKRRGSAILGGRIEIPVMREASTK